MNVETVMMGLGMWLAIGLLIAVGFGRFSRRADIPEDVTELAPPVVSHLRPRKRGIEIAEGKVSGASCPAAFGMVTKPRRRVARTS